MIYSTTPSLLEIEFIVEQTVNPLELTHSGKLIESRDLGDNNRLERIEVNDLNNHCRFGVSGKSPQDTMVRDGTIVKDACVKIEDVWINGVLIEKWALEKFCSFRPEYDISNRTYALENNITLPEVIPGMLALYYNGSFEIELVDFFHRYHSYLMAPLQQYNHWVLHSHLGHVNQSTKNDLYNILKNL